MAGDKGGQKGDVTHGTTVLEVRRVDDETALVDVVGDVTRESEAAFMDAYERAATGTTKTIVLNFSGLEYLNSGGIGLLISLLVRARGREQRLVAFGLNDHYRNIFELTRLDEAIQVVESEAHAVAVATLSDEGASRRQCGALKG